MLDFVNDLKLRTRLLGSFLVLAALVGLVGSWGLYNQWKVSASLETVVEDRVVPLQQLQGIANGYAVEVVDASQKVEAGAMGWAEGLAAVRGARAEGRTLWAEYLETSLTPEEERLAAEAEAALERAAPVLDELESVLERRDREALDAFLETRLYPAVDPFTGSLTALVDLQLDVARRVYDRSVAASTRATVVTVAGMLLAILGAVLFGILIARSVSVPLLRTVEAMKRQSEGIVTDRLELERGDEIGEMAVAFDTFNHKLENFLVRWLDELARGELDVDVPEQSGDDMIAPAVRRIRDSLRALTVETGSLIQAAKAGDLATRADASRVQGAYADIVRGVNETLDAVILPIQEASEVLERVADRDMTARVEGDYQGDLALVKRSLNRAVANLETALQEVAGATEQVSGAAVQISESSQELAQGTGEQASTLEEVSSSLQELSSMSRQNSANAKEASGIARESFDGLEQAAERMAGLSEAIASIDASSGETARIVKTIDEIAFQTNLLALNAAVEAARAGEAGKGFAVVAEEVRDLAQRSAEAARTTADLIGAARERAEAGVELNQAVQESLETLAEGTRRSTELVAEIAAASGQQSEGVEQITEAVEQMNAVTQQTAAASEEGASTAEELSSQAEQLEALVGRFRISVLGESGAGARQPAATAGGTAPARSRGGTGGEPGASNGIPKNRVAALTAATGAGEDGEVLGEF